MRWENGSCAACKEDGWIYMPKVEQWWMEWKEGWCQKCWVEHYSKKLVELKEDEKMKKKVKMNRWGVKKKGKV